MFPPSFLDYLLSCGFGFNRLHWVAYVLLYLLRSLLYLGLVLLGVLYFGSFLFMTMRMLTSIS
jgi:hypothetical protein